MNNQPTSPEITPETPTPTSPLLEATNLEDVANNLEKILKNTKDSPIKEIDGFVLVERDAGLLEAAIAQIRAIKQQPQSQEKPRSLLSRLTGLFKGGKKTRKNRGKNKTRRNKNKTRRNKSLNKRKKNRK